MFSNQKPNGNLYFGPSHRPSSGEASLVSELHLQAFSNSFVGCCHAESTTGQLMARAQSLAPALLWHCQLSMLLMPLYLEALTNGPAPCTQGKNLGRKEFHFPPGEGGCGDAALMGMWKIISGRCWSIPVWHHSGAGSLPPGMQQSISIPTGLSQDLLFALE